MVYRSLFRRVKRAALLTTLLCSPFALTLPVASRADAPPAELSGHLPALVFRSSRIGRIGKDQPIRMALSLPLRDQAGLDDFLARVSNPDDPLYGHYLTPAEFTARFGPTQADYDAVIAFAKAQGFTITATHSNRILLDVSGPAAAVEKAFAIQMLRYQAPNGRLFRAPNANPKIPAVVADKISGIIGLDDAGIWRTHNVVRDPIMTILGGPGGVPHAIGSGPGGGLSPSDIKTAYNLSGTSLTGAGQSLALFELDGYVASDITAYKSFFGLANTPLQNVLVDGFSGSAGSGRGEVTLDIELQIALAPGVSKIYVYEGPNSSAGVVDTYNRIATDNLAKSVSTSWGLYETGSAASTRNSENTIFQQMAAQGQSIFAASGDSGAYDNGSSLSVDDPASQPYMTGVGGTRLSVSSAGGPYVSETTWNGGSINAGGGGGGISTVWTIPSYQAGIISGASKGSTTNRNVPDVSLNSDPNTGYAIYVSGGWQVYGGTSCAAPLWSAFTALVNQQRAANGLSTLGFANTPLYNVGKGANYSADFHDIADNSTNLFYPAVTGFDEATGWGTFKGTSLLADLAGGGGGGTVPAAPTGLTATAGTGQVSLAWSASSGATSYNVYRGTTSGGETLLQSGLTATTFTNTGLTAGTTYFYQVTAVNATGESTKSNEASAVPTSGGTVQQLLGNPGFENGSASPAPWVVTAGVIDSSASEAAHGGLWKAWLDGYGSAHTDSVYQQVAIPASVTSASLSFWLHIDTAETTTTVAYDTLKVQIRNSAGTVLATLATYSNLNKNTGFLQKSFSLLAYKGQTVRVYLLGVEDSSLQTSFVVDDFALNVQ